VDQEITLMYSGNTEAKSPASLLVQARMTFDWMTSGGMPSSRKIRHPGVARCLQFLRKNPRAQLTLRHLQRASGLKRRGLHKAFVTHLGCTPGVLLRKMRLERACHLLAHSNLSVDELARRCGYRGANSLWVSFMRDMGIAPVRFRTQQRLITGNALVRSKKRR
jgi:transcriptional regulator GlxA family with amidase domain